MLRRVLPLIIAIAALAVPASADAGFAAKRVAMAHIAPTSPRHHHGARLAGLNACPDADLMPARSDLGRIRAAVLCLHNQVRAQHGLPVLHDASRLRQAASAHSADMVDHRYFEHTTPGGRTMVDRILAAGYVRANAGWMLGENLEWGTGSLATPRGAVQAWLNSPEHRANLLRRGYREVGIGVAVGVPTGGSPGATYTVDFGTRL